MDDKRVFIECELILEGKKQSEAEVAQQVSAAYCFRCGYRRDAQLRNLQLYCFSPKSPYLAELKKRLKV